MDGSDNTRFFLYFSILNKGRLEALHSFALDKRTRTLVVLTMLSFLTFVTLCFLSFSFVIFTIKDILVNCFNLLCFVFYFLR